MSCSTCDSTMQSIVDGLWHCPRCGTVHTKDGQVYVPVLVERAAFFVQVCIEATEDNPGVNAAIRDLANRHGILEACMLPDERRKILGTA